MIWMPYQAWLFWDRRGRKHDREGGGSFICFVVFPLVGAGGVISGVGGVSCKPALSLPPAYQSAGPATLTESPCPGSLFASVFASLTQ